MHSRNAFLSLSTVPAGRENEESLKAVTLEESGDPVKPGDAEATLESVPSSAGEREVPIANPWTCNNVWHRRNYPQRTSVCSDGLEENGAMSHGPHRNSRDGSRVLQTFRQEDYPEIFPREDPDNRRCLNRCARYFHISIHLYSHALEAESLV